MVSQYGQFIHLQGLAKLLFLCVQEGPAFFETDEHQVIPVGEGQGLALDGDLSCGQPEAFIGFQLAALQHHQVPLSGAPEIQIEDLARGEAAGFEDAQALGCQGLQVGADIEFGLEGPSQGTLGFTLQGFPELANGFEAETEAGGHQLTVFRNGVRSMPKICPMASMARR